MVNWPSLKIGTRRTETESVSHFLPDYCNPISNSALVPFYNQVSHIVRKEFLIQTWKIEWDTEERKSWTEEKLTV